VKLIPKISNSVVHILLVTMIEGKFILSSKNYQMAKAAVKQSANNRLARVCRLGDHMVISPSPRQYQRKKSFLLVLELDLLRYISKQKHSLKKIQKHRYNFYFEYELKQISFIKRYFKNGLRYTLIFRIIFVSHSESIIFITHEE